MLTQEADYAIRTILYLSKLGQGKKVNAQTISDNMKIPHRFLLKFLQKLKKAGLVESFMGVHGGYALTKEPKDISILEVVEAIDGPVVINRCFRSSELCNRTTPEKCSVHQALYDIQKNLEKELSSITFDTLVKEEI